MLSTQRLAEVFVQFWAPWMGAKSPEGNNKIMGGLENVYELRLKDVELF